MPPLTVTPVLKAAAELKIRELRRVKDSFKRRYHLDVRRSAEPSTLKRVSQLLEDIKKLDSYLETNDDLSIMTRYIEQAKNDRSVPEAKLLKYEKQLWDKLTQHLNRFEVSSLHVDLMKEVIDAQSSVGSTAAKLEKAALEDDFEMVENELEEVLEKFEKDNFIPKNVDEKAIDAYLAGLFHEKRGPRCLSRIRSQMALSSETEKDETLELSEEWLMWAIMELLKNDLVSEEKKLLLESYLQSPIAVQELMTTLKMKDYKQWNYYGNEQGLAVSARQNSDGRYCITVEEDIVDMLYLTCIGASWATLLKMTMTTYEQRSGVFETETLGCDERDRRDYFLHPFTRRFIPQSNGCINCAGFIPVAPMPPPIVDAFGLPLPPVCIPYMPDRKSKKKRYQAGPPPPPPSSSLSQERSKNYVKDFFLSRLPECEGCAPKVTRVEETQATLIKILAADAKLRKAFDGKPHVFATTFDSLASSIPHKTIITVLKFLGVTQDCLDFFTRVLEANLNIGPAMRGTPDRILSRARGLSAGHALEKFFSEAVLIFLEIAVFQKTGAYLYRLHDQCFFIGTEEQKAKCVAEVTNFATIMGLEFKNSPLGGQKLAIGCLIMDTSLEPSSAAKFEIDNTAVDAYANCVKKQLAARTTTLEWIRHWNNTIGTYATHLFGPLADVLGKVHLESVKAAYNRIFSIVLDGEDLTTHVKNLLTSRVKRTLSSPPFDLEALIYLPDAYGGLGVKNPFIALNLAHKLDDNPDTRIESYMKDEEEYYLRAAEIYNSLTAEERQQKHANVFDGDVDLSNAALGQNRDLSVFLSREELFAHRESGTLPYPAERPYPAAPPRYVPIPNLLNLYEDLLREPIDNIDVSEKVSEDIARLSHNGDMKPEHKLSSEDLWVLQMYGDECFERYGTLEAWWPDGVPREVYKAVKGHVWGDGDDDFDGSSDGTMSEV